MNSNGSDLNAGSTCSDVGGGSNAAVYTSTAGNFDGTSVFTPTDGQTTSSLVAANDWVSLYNTGDTAARCIVKVQSVGAGVNGTITVDVATKYGTVPTSNSGSRACKAGGSLASLGITATNAAFNTGTILQSTRVNIKAGTYANTTTSRTLAMVGTAILQLWWRGYNTTPGDLDNVNTSTAGTTMPSITYTTGQETHSGAHSKFSSITFTGATVASNGLVVSTGADIDYYRCRFINTAANANSRAITCGASSLGIMVGCWLQSTTTADRCFSSTGLMSLFGCTITGGIIGALPGAAGSIIGFCMFDSQAGDAISVGSSINAIIFNCGVYAPTGNGISFTGTIVKSTVTNCYFSTVNQAAKAAINNTTGTNTDRITCTGNTFFNCTANYTGLTENFTIFDNGTLGSEAFVAPASQNFTLLPVGQGLGFPGLFENVSAYQGYLDPGAVQHAPSLGTRNPFPGSGGII